MTKLAIDGGWFPDGTPLAVAAVQARTMGADGLLLTPGLSAVTRETARSSPASIVGVRPAPEGTLLQAETPAGAKALEAAVARASRAGAPRLVVEGGRLEGLADADRALRLGAVELATVVGSRAEVHEAATVRAARAAHALLEQGVPVALRPGGHAADLLGPVETRWLLDDLPGLTLAVDPMRGERLRRLGLAGDPAAYLAALPGDRIVLVFAQGLDGDGEEGSHPEDGGDLWGTLAGVLPRKAPWVLAAGRSLDAGDTKDALRFLTALGRR